MWRTLVVNSAERIRLKDNWLIVETDDNEERIPINEIYSLVIDNPLTTLSVGAVNALTENRVKRNLPKNGSVRLLSVTEKQYASMMLLVGEETKEEIFLKTKEILEL